MDVRESVTKRVGEANKRLILNAVRRRPSMSVEALVRTTRRSQPTVLKWLAQLERDHYVVRHGQGASTGGRPPSLYRFHAERNHVLGISLEIPDASLALVDLRGEEIAATDWRLDAEAAPAALLDDVAERAAAFVHEHLGASAPSRAGVVLSGFIDEQRGVSLATPRLLDWHDVPVREDLERRLGVPVTLRHHIDALTLSEVCVGAAQEWRDFLYFDVGYGLGVRLVRHGHHVAGSFGNAGLIGHTTVVPDGRPCLCGNRGCLEEYVSGRAVPNPFRSLGKGEAEAGRGIERLTYFLSIGLANAINLFDVPQVILSGFVRDGGDGWRASLEEATRRRLQRTLAQSVRIAFAEVSRRRAGALGAALFALREHLPFAEPLVAPRDVPGEEVSALGYTPEHVTP